MSDSEYSSSESSDQDEDAPKPVFVPKNKRVVLQDRTEREVALQESQRLREDEIRAAQAKDREAAIHRSTQENETETSLRTLEGGAKSTGETMLKPPPIGDEDTPEEYQKWQLRELKRLLAYKKTGCFVQEEYT